MAEGGSARQAAEPGIAELISRRDPLDDFEARELCFLGQSRTVFVAGTLWWALIQVFIYLAQPDWPRWTLFAITALAAIGYAVADLMPWSMLGEVIDEDDLATGERREGLYNGMFTFLRKLGGAVGVFLVMGALDLLGYEKGREQTETARQAIRWMTALAPVPFLAVGVWLARGYPLTRRRHLEIQAALAARSQRPATGGAS